MPARKALSVLGMEGALRTIFAALGLAAALAACGQPQQAPVTTTSTAVAAQPGPAIWFICDSLSTPDVLVFTDGPATGHTRLIRYDKRSGATVAAQNDEYTIGSAEGAAGSLYTTISNGAGEIVVRSLNRGMLETPGAAYTTPITSVRLGRTDMDCRWMPRTRLMGITGRRTVVIHEDGDGDLIYSTYDFPASARAQRVELSENARTTTFSVEVRDGEEHVNVEGSEFVFTNGGYRYTMRAMHGPAEVLVARDGRTIQTEPLLAYMLGDAQATAN